MPLFRVEGRSLTPPPGNSMHESSLLLG